jgi:hypothetical protein
VSSRVRVVASAGLALGVVAGVALSLSPPSVGQSIGGSQAPAREVEVLNELVVRVADPISLDTSSLDTITSATDKGNCTYSDGDPTATISTTAANIPASPLSNRTAIVIWNHSTAPANVLICSASGTATLAKGLRVESGHQWWKWEGLGGGGAISCRCATGTCTYGYLEERCYQ